MSEDQSFTGKVEDVKRAIREVSGQGDEYKEAMRKAVADLAAGQPRAENQKLDAFSAGVRDAVYQWLSHNKEDVLTAVFNANRK